MSAAAWRMAAHWRRPAALPMALGGLALLAAAGLSLVAVPRWQADTRAAGQALHQRAALARPVAATTPPAARPAQRLHAALPAAGEAPQRMAALLDLAQRHGVAVSSARQSPASALGGIAAVPLAWRAQGRYADLRIFVAAALQADTGLVLDQLRLSRADNRAALLDADLQWQLLQQAGPVPVPAATTAQAAR